MGLLQQGRWVDRWYDTQSSGGEFVRQDSRFRNWITPDGEQGFKAEKGRYHLYVSLACPWAHRTLIFRKLKKLEDYIDVTVVDPIMLENGWELNDPLYNIDYLYQLYLKADASYEGRVTVPVLWDKQTESIVNNESSEIIRMLNFAFNEITGNFDDYWPKDLRDNIEGFNSRIYSDVNNGVYKCGFATSQSAYDAAIQPLFDALDWLEDHLTTNRYLMGQTLTEADWRLFTTLIRFDSVYHLHFKCNRNRVIDYPNLWAYVRELYQWPGVADTVNMDHIVRHYHYSHDTINPNRILPINPVLDYHAPHGRESL